MKKYNKVVAQAWNDYDANIVQVIEEKLLNLNFTDEEKTILAENEIQALEDKDIKESIYFLIALNSINYQYWDIIDGQFVRYQNRGKIGALAAFDGFVMLYNHLKTCNFNLSFLNEDLMKQCFGEIPDIAHRIEILKESMDKEKSLQVYEAINKHIVSKPIDVELADNIANIMPISFKEPYLKKIQLSLYEIAQTYNYRGFNIHCDITVAADYQIPKVLEAMGILKYNDQLKIKIDSLELIEAQSKEERALRSATVIACEMISEKYGISIPALDRYLWMARNDFKNKKFHLTKGSNY